MTKHMSVEVPFVLKTSTTSLVFTHVVGFFLVCDLMLLQSTFEGVALAAVLTNKTKVTMEVHMFVKRGLYCKFFVTLLTLNNPVVLFVMFIKLFNSTEQIYANFAPYSAGRFAAYQGTVRCFHR